MTLFNIAEANPTMLKLSSAAVQSERPAMMGRRERLTNKDDLSPNIIQAMIAVNIGAEDLIVSENETATYFKVMREQTIVANLIQPKIAMLRKK